jgi:hypothetical protein
VSKRGNSFINSGDKYPNQTFSGWIQFGAPLASDSSLELLQGKTVKVTGVISFTTGSLRSKSPHRIRSFQNEQTATPFLLART